MIRLTIDPAFQAQLQQAGGRVELCNEQGQTVGFFVPFTQNSPDGYEWLRSQISDDEIQQRLSEPTGRTTAEVLKRLHEQ